jgi:hypothetical protein
MVHLIVEVYFVKPRVVNT